MSNIEISDPEEFIDYPEDFGFSWVTEEDILDRTRWSIIYSRVAKRVSDDTYWKLSWETGATEYQDVPLELSHHQVYPHVVTITVYKKEPNE